MRKTSAIALSVWALAVLVCSALSCSAAFAADFPTGSYTAKGLHITFEGNGKFSAGEGSETKVSGTYTVSGNQLKLTDASGPWACKAAQQTGTYSWKFEDGALSLSKVSDSCADRVSSLTSSSWQPKK
jgi:hypothetical protein